MIIRFPLVLLDEFEKADPKILDLFLQVLDDGRLTDNKGKTISFANVIIIATSNAGSEFIREEIQKGLLIDKTFKTNLLDYLQKQGNF
jgi:ATP-dependent Clp protease ATP-binding subunit ClpA